MKAASGEHGSEKDKEKDEAKGKKSSSAAGVRSQLTEEQRAFIRTLNSEMQKFNKFFINSEEDFVMKESRLDDEYRMVVDEETGGPSSTGYTPDQHRRILRAFADFHGELVLMEHWVSLNYTARGGRGREGKCWALWWREATFLADFRTQFPLKTKP